MKQPQALNLGVIGGGNMARALLSGLLGSSIWQPHQLLASDPDAARRRALADAHGIEVTDDNQAIAARSDVIVLAVKPQVMPRALADCSAHVTRDKLFISVAAGTTTHTLEQGLGSAPRVIRAMPNTPALVRAGATAVCAGSHAHPTDLDFAERLFQSVGIVVRVPEKLFDAVTALSGSGPGYMMLILEALIEAGVNLGLSKNVAEQLVVQTMLGSATLQQQTGHDPAQLRVQVTSPGGTTSAGLAALERLGTRHALMTAVESAHARSKELANPTG